MRTKGDLSDFERGVIYWGFILTTISGLQRIIWKRENIQWAAVRADRKTTVTQITSRYDRDERTNTWNLEADELQQHQTTAGVTSVSWETEATVLTGSPELDNRRLKKRHLVWWVSVSAATLRWLSQNWRKQHDGVDSGCWFDGLGDNF